MISPERKQFNADVRELGELHDNFNEKLKASLITLLKTQPKNKISFKHDKPKMVKDISNGKITLATMSSIWVEDDSIMAQLVWKDDGVAFNEAEHIDMELGDIYPNIFNLTSNIQNTLKEKENPKPQAEKKTMEAQPEQQSSFLGKILGKLMLLCACATAMPLLASQSVQLDSVQFDNAGMQSTCVFEYQPEQNTITCFSRHYDWENHDWETTGKSVLFQDAHTVNYSSYSYNNNQWELVDYPHIYEYDDNGNMIAQSANGQRETWEYSTSGDLMKKSHYQWENEAWKLTSYADYEYINGLKSSYKEYNLSYFSSEFYLSKSSTYTYDENNKLTMISTTSAGKNYQTVYSYTETTTTQVTSLWDNTNSVWIPQTKSEEIVSSDGKHTEIYYNRNENNSDWIASQKYEYTLATADRYSYEIYYRDIEGALTPDYRRYFEYDEHGNLIDYKQENYQGDTQWRLTFHNQYTYDYTIIASNAIGCVSFEEYMKNGGVKHVY